MNSLLLCFSISALLTLALVKEQVDSYTEDFRKVDKKRSTNSKDVKLLYCPPLPEVGDDKPRETINEYCYIEDRKRSLKKIDDLKAEILSLQKEVNEEKNSKTALQKEIKELNQKIIEDKNEISILKAKIVQLSQSVNEEKNSKTTIQKEIQELNQSIPEFVEQNLTRDIFEASKKGSLEGVRFWYSKEPTSIHGKNQNDNNFTSLHYASAYGHLPIVEFLLSKGVDIEAETSSSTTALMFASVEGHVPIVKALLDKGANINHQNQNKWTPLHWAVLGNQLEIVKVLIERGADKSLRDNKNRTPLDGAREKGYKSIMDYLSSL